MRHKVALEILVSGYIEAYIEFFNITEHKPEWNDDNDILHVLQLNLARAEESRRKNDFLLACNSYNQLAAFFESAGDKETAAMFYEYCLKSIIATPSNFGKKAEIYAQIGLLAEHRGDLTGSRNAFLKMYDISSQNGVTGQFGQPSACRHLVRVTTGIVDKLEAAGSWAHSVELLQHNLQLATESKTADLLPNIDFRLGCAYEKTNDFSSAVQHLERFVDSPADEISRAKACTSLSRCYEQLGDVDAAIQFLLQLVTSGVASGQLAIATSASTSLGSIYTKKGDYPTALVHLKQAFELQVSIGGLKAIAESRVRYGIAQARVNASKFTEAICSNQLQQLLLAKGSVVSTSIAAPIQQESISSPQGEELASPDEPTEVSSPEQGERPVDVPAL